MQNLADTLVVISSGVTPELDEVSKFTQNDPYGFLMAMLGMGIVFLILVLLVVVFSNTPVLYTIDFRARLSELVSSQKRIEVKGEGEKRPLSDNKSLALSGEVNAAIAAAIHLYRSEMHDYENTVLTISKVSRTYSPWSSKIYGLRNTPR
jgi:glutaconyl-CoA/methylmalonyl-CoA decarboxylase subunit delta